MNPSGSKHWFITVVIGKVGTVDISLPSHAALIISREHKLLCTVLFLSISDYEIQAGSCMSVKLLALRPGFSVLTVSYQYKEIILKASVTVGAYHPLKVSYNSVSVQRLNKLVHWRHRIDVPRTQDSSPSPALPQRPYLGQLAVQLSLRELLLRYDNVCCTPHVLIG